MAWSDETRLLGWNIAPLLDDGSLHLVRVRLGPGADFFRDVHTLLHRHQLRHQLCHLQRTTVLMSGCGLWAVRDRYLVTRLDRLESALLHRVVNHHGLHPVVADDGTLAREIEINKSSIAREKYKCKTDFRFYIKSFDVIRQIRQACQHSRISDGTDLSHFLH